MTNDHDDLRARVARLESDTAYLRRELSVLTSQLSVYANQGARNRDSISDLWTRVNAEQHERPSAMEECRSERDKAVELLRKTLNPACVFDAAQTEAWAFLHWFDAKGPR